MLFRMRRNGAGLASICILSTMVLVMLSTTGCLFWGKEAALQQRFPQDIIFSIYDVFYPADEAAADERPGLAERQNYIPVYRELIEAGKIYLFLFMCMDILPACTDMCTMCMPGVVDSPGTGVTDSCELPCECWE